MPVAYQDVSHWAASFAAEVAMTLANRSEDSATRAGLLNNLANKFSQLGRREEALPRAEEATSLCCQLAQARALAFTPNLALSLNTLANILSALGRHQEALPRAEEAVRTLAPFFLSEPPAFASWMGKLVSAYRGCCEAAGKEPDAELLHSIGVRFGSV